MGIVSASTQQCHITTTKIRLMRSAQQQHTVEQWFRHTPYSRTALPRFFISLPHFLELGGLLLPGLNAVPQ
jgi:hypothetical protein